MSEFVSPNHRYPVLTNHPVAVQHQQNEAHLQHDPRWGGWQRDSETRCQPNLTRNDISMQAYNKSNLAGTFGSIQVGHHDEGVVIDITACNYDTSGVLHTDQAFVRLPVNDAIRLHALLADAIVAAELKNIRQPELWASDPFALRA